MEVRWEEGFFSSLDFLEFQNPDLEIQNRGGQSADLMPKYPDVLYCPVVSFHDSLLRTVPNTNIGVLNHLTTQAVSE